MIIYTSSSSNLAKQIKKLRVKQKITQADLAKLCGIHSETYRKWETGKGSTSVENLIRIMKVLCNVEGGLLLSVNSKDEISNLDSDSHESI